MVFSLSDDVAALVGMIVSLTLLNTPRNNTRNLCRLTQSTVPSADANISRKKEAIFEHSREAPSCHVGKDSFENECFKVGKSSVVRRVHI